jgi:uncharacterized membrane protein YhaH (DUF805 family)
MQIEQIVDNYTSVLKKYSDYSGRSNRSEYWYFVLANLVVSAGFSMFSRMIGNDSNFLGSLYSLVVLLPGIAVSIRRLHDIGKSGWMMLVSLIPFAGPIWLIILMATKGDLKKNEYGAVTGKTKTK